MTWRATVLTLFPGMFPGPLGDSLAGRALAAGLWSLDAQDIRASATDRHRSVDDTPFGGGAGMVLRPDVVAAALRATDDGRPTVFLTPRGRPLTQADARRFAAQPGLILLCGRYEGIDQRVIDASDAEEISAGDYVLSGGELPAMVLLDSIIRLLPGVMGAAESALEESFCRRPARISALHPPGGLGGQGGAACSAVRQPRRHCRLASGGGRKDHPGTQARHVGNLCCFDCIDGHRTVITLSQKDFRPMNIIQTFEAEEIARLTAVRAVPVFAPGDTVRVSVKVVEGERTRVQAYEGVCIARSNKALNSNFTVRKISYGEGVERVFPLYSPQIAEIEVIRRGDVRRAKLYYLRGRRGKSARIAEKARDTSAPKEVAAE